MRVLKYAQSAAVAAGVALLSATPGQAQGVLKAPIADWTGGAVTCHILQVILEDEMGYKLKRITMPSGPGVFEGIRAGDLDFACETWPSYSPSKEEYVTEFGGDGTVKYFGAVGVVGQSGYYVPRYMIEGDAARGIEATAPNLKTWEDLNQYADLFKSLESGDQGRLIACPVSAWLCMDKERVEGLGLNFSTIELGSETAHWAEIKAAYDRGEPFIAYAWEPHWIHAALDLVEVKLPDYSEAAWPVSDWPQDITFNYGRPALEQEHPDVAALISSMNLSNQMQAGIILEIDVNGRDMDEVVREWMAANEDIWRGWMPKS